MGDFGGRKTEKVTGSVTSSNPFFSDIDLGDFQAKMRINSEYRLETLQHRVVQGIRFVNGELFDQVAIWNKAGIATLDALSPNKVNDVFVAVEAYQSAVYAFAKAKLLQDYASMNRRDKAENEAKESSGTFDDYMADCHDEINFLTSIQTGEKASSLDIYDI